MSMAIWTQFRLQDGTIISDETDKYQMLEYMETLDELCKELHIPMLSNLLNYSDALNDVDDDWDEEDQERLHELNLDYNDDEQSWHPPREAIYILDTLLDNLNAQPDFLNAPQHHVDELLEEFEQCLSFSQDALEQGSEQFRLILMA
ncbi:MAG: hypothetical protein ACRCWR_07930 [Saezia sp.]